MTINIYTFYVIYSNSFGWNCYRIKLNNYYYDLLCFILLSEYILLLDNVLIERSSK